MKKRNRITQAITLLGLFSFVALAGCSDNPADSDVVTLTVGAEMATVNLAMGKSSYDTQCQGCHGDMGQGGSRPVPLNNYMSGQPYATFSTLETKINTTMPQGTPAACGIDCADNVTGYIYCSWNPTLVTSGCP